MDLDNFVFDDDEKPKKKKKPKKSTKPQLQSKEFYEAKLSQLNERLATLRKLFAKRNEENRKLTTDLVTIEEDRIEVCQYLERTIKSRKSSIRELHTTLIQLKEQCEDYKKTSQEKIIELQKQYEIDHGQLINEIKLQIKALNSLDEFRIKRDKALESYEFHHDGIAELELKTQEHLFNMEQRAVIQKSILKKQVEERLENLVQDFLHSKEIRNAGFTRGLIQENITLKRKLDKLVKTNIRAIDLREKQIIKTKEIMESYASLEHLTEQLQRSIENKNNIIQRLNMKIDRLRMRYIEAKRFRRLHDIAKERGVLNSGGPKNLQNVVAYLERLKNKKDAIIQRQRSQENEIHQMRQILDTLQVTVEKSVLSLQKSGTKKTLDAAERSVAISALIFLTLSDSLEELNYSAFYRPGTCGLIPGILRTDELLKVIYMRSKNKPKPAVKIDEPIFKGSGMGLFVETSETYSDCSWQPECCDLFLLYLKKTIPRFPKPRDIEYVIDTTPTTDFIRTEDQFEKCFENAQRS